MKPECRRGCRSSQQKHLGSANAVVCCTRWCDAARGSRDKSSLHRLQGLRQPCARDRSLSRAMSSSAHPASLDHNLCDDLDLLQSRRSSARSPSSVRARGNEAASSHNEDLFETERCRHGLQLPGSKLDLALEMIGG
eukprot:6191029-Pleurochrysis_carterae.AAC.2